LAAIDAAMERLTVDGDAHREAMLARGKLLTRLDKRDEAESLFHNAISQKWNHAMWRYSESLMESDQMAESCIMECNRIAGLEKYKHYLSEGESLEIFLTLLRLTKHHDSEISVVDDVSRQLSDITDKQHFSRIAKALCFAEDGYTDEAVALLDEIDAQLSEKKDHRDYKHLPLYKASILFKEGKNYPVAQAAFTEFMKRNEGKNKKIITSALRLARDIEIQHKSCNKIDEFATFLIGSKWFKDDAVINNISINSVASLYDMQQIGLINSGERTQGLEICKFVMDNFKGTLAAANCAKTYIHSLSAKMDESELVDYYRQILDQNEDDTLRAIIHFYLAKISRKNGDNDTALQHLDEALVSANPYDKGLKADFREMCIRLRDRIKESASPK
jgi:predicted negative regulator of RcsB-dependent stress response